MHELVDREHDAHPARSWLARNGTWIVLVALALYLLLRYFDIDELTRVVIAAIGLGFVIFAHELGHFLVAKSCDVHVETFSIGFGPPLPGCSFKWGETTYMLAAFPLGGYVKMVGEGTEADEGDDDPRSFKHKPVWQRMAIISAGVTMNVILAFACFVFVYRTHGAERAPGVVDRVEPGSPAWKLGVRTGDVIHGIGSKGPNPYFDDLRPVVMNSKEGEKLNFVWSQPDQPEKDWQHAQIEPRRMAEDSRPVIGIAPPPEPTLPPAQARKRHEFPYFYTSAAAAAEPRFEFGDTIIATSDPLDPKKLLPLPSDPRGSGHADYFEYLRRLHLLAGKEMLIRVRREEPPEEVTMTVPPAYHYTLGLRMRMGKIAAVRDGSPAALAGVRAEDIIDRVEVTDSAGQVTRYVTSRSKGPLRSKVQEVDLDPMRLRHDLRRWAESLGPGAKRRVGITVLRTNPSNPVNHTERQEIALTLDWDDSRRFENESPITPNSPISIPELGIAYRVETRVEGLYPEAPARSARVLRPAQVKYRKGDRIERDGRVLQAVEGETVSVQVGDLISLVPGDVVVASQAPVAARRMNDQPALAKWTDLKSDQWAWLFWSYQDSDFKDVSLRLERDNLEVAVTAVADKSWPAVERGLLLVPDKRLQKAHSLAEAMGMGLNETLNFITQIYQNLQGIMTGRVSPENFGGPIMIAQLAYVIAADPYQFLVFLGIISINLAVINFLPIPVLDGGHMMFLIYEKLRGKPAPRRVLETATYVGLAFIVSLMLAVIYLDAMRIVRPQG
jgi:regulator of sigma E protease